MHSLEQLQSKVKELGIPNTTVAHLSGKSTSTISQVMNGKYNGRPEVLSEIYDALIGYEESRADDSSLAGTIQWLTEGEKLINGILDLTYHTCGFSAVVGPSGIGKTFTSRLFEAAHPDVLYMRCADGMSMGDVISFLLESVQVPAYGTKTQKLRRCIQALKDKGVRMILVDEADLLVTEGSKPAILKKISVFREIKEAGIGVAMIGLESFDDALRVVGETYVTSRIDYFRKVRDTAREELAYYLGLQGFDPETSEGQHAISLAPKRGSLRFLAKLCSTAGILGGIKEAITVTFTASGQIKEV